MLCTEEDVIRSEDFKEQFSEQGTGEATWGSSQSLEPRWSGRGAATAGHTR